MAHSARARSSETRMWTGGKRAALSTMTNERYWHYGMVLLGDPTLTWWKGNVPQPTQPTNGQVFSHYPRTMQFRWNPVNLPGVKYTVEVDAFHAIHANQWAEQTGEVFAHVP